MHGLLEADHRPESPALVMRTDNRSDKRALAPTQSTQSMLGAIELLDCAERALSTSRNDARRYIDRAAEILKTACDQPVAAKRDMPPPARLPLAPWQLSRVTRFIESNLDDAIKIKGLAAIARLSPSYFCRAFKHSLGVSPYAYVVRRRVECAREMLTGSERPLAEIALNCGFTDQSHLTRMFKRSVGVSPGAWRRVQRDRAVGCLQRA